MNTIDKIYNPYDFSSTRCYVVVVEPLGKDLAKIEHKLPGFIRTIKGVYVTCTFYSPSPQPIKHIGILSLNFNGNAFKSFHLAVPNAKIQPETSNPITLNETIHPNSFLQGYFYGLESLMAHYKISIYIHYDYQRP